MKWTCIIVDDEYPARVLLQEYISKIPDMELKGVFKNPIDALAFLSSTQTDIMFLDIQMPDLNGLELIKTLKNKPGIILTTAYSEFALESYELDVADYLLKPISLPRFMQAINKVKERLRPPVTAASPGESKTYLYIKADHKIHRVPADDILYIEGLREYVTYFTRTGKIIALESLKKLEETLPEGKFLRVHKSYIINSDAVKSLYGNSLIINDKNIPIGHSYRDTVLKKLF